MRFADETRIIIMSGVGGNGCVSFRRERFLPKGGPNGGDGGNGGDVIIKASSKKRTLRHLIANSVLKAGSGSNGQGNNKSGRKGQDLTIDVPIGTTIINQSTNSILHDLVTENSLFLIAKGGRGGRGNSKFKTPTNRSPRFAQDGETGKSLALKLELKLLADVGIIGLPNSGKSTLLSVMSSAKPKIGNFPFTTLTPNLGIVETNKIEPFIVADIPGLIEGAHNGLGLGIRFLKHIERTNILVHLIDISQISLDDPLRDVNIVEKELLSYGKNLSSKPRLMVLNKIDLTLITMNNIVESFKQACANRNCDFLCISAATGQGIQKLILKISEFL